MSDLIHPELAAALAVLVAKDVRVNFSLHDVPVAAFTELADVSVLRVVEGDRSRLLLTGSETHGDLRVRCYSVDLPQSELEQAA